MGKSTGQIGTMVRRRREKCKVKGPVAEGIPETAFFEKKRVDFSFDIHRLGYFRCAEAAEAALCTV